MLTTSLENRVPLFMSQTQRDACRHLGRCGSLRTVQLNIMCVWGGGYCQHTLQCPPLNSVPRCHSCHIQATRMHSPHQFPLYHLLHIVRVNERCRRKEERSKHGYTNNKAKQHNTPKAVTFPKKNELPWVGFKPTTLRALHQLNYRSRSSG